MATCYVEITEAVASGDSETYVTLQNNVFVEFTFSINSKVKLRLNTDKQETIVGTFQALSNMSSASITFFRLNGDEVSITSQGSVNLTDSNITFQKDVIPGQYFLCFSSIDPITCKFKATFSEYTVEPRLPCKAYDGCYAEATITVKKPERFCDEPMKYRFIDGELPPGLELREDGVIFGTLPELDCMPDANEQSPSIHWYFQNTDGNWESCNRRWKFQAQVYLVNFPDVTDTETFFIEVYNDWSADRDGFMERHDEGWDRTIRIPISSLVDPMKVPQCCTGLGLTKDPNIITTPSGLRVPAPQIQRTVSPLETINTVIPAELPAGRATEHLDQVFMDIGSSLNATYRPFDARGHFGSYMEVTVTWPY